MAEPALTPLAVVGPLDELAAGFADLWMICAWRQANRLLLTALAQR
ncbi:MAG: hypothetical protein ACYDEA_07450 [Candidatus Dormibacteria bacterium]